MKILFVCPYFHPQIGGLENYVLNIATSLKMFGHECVVATSSTQRNENSEETVDGIKVYRLRSMFKLSNTPINPLWLFSLKTIINKEKPDLINAHSPVPFISDCSFLVRGKANFVLTYHAGSMVKNSFFTDILIQAYEKTILQFLFKNSDGVICTSADLFERKLKDLNKKAALIQPGVDTSLFTPSKNKKLNNSLLYVGKIDSTASTKGINILLDSVKILRSKGFEVSLTLVGGGNAIGTYLNHIKQSTIAEHVTFKGELRGHELVKLYQRSRILILPSLTEAEAFGMVLIEAMACKTLVIGTNVGGVPYLIGDKINGILVRPNDATDLASAVAEVLLDEAFSERLIENAYSKVKQDFNWSEKAQKYENFLREVKS